MFQQNSNSMSSIIGPDLEINGDINIKGDLLIYGQVTGNVNCDGLITTMKDSIVSGSIITNFADISGKVDGNIEAKNKVYREQERQDTRFLANLETITGFRHLDEIVGIGSSEDGLDGLSDKP